MSATLANLVVEFEPEFMEAPRLTTVQALLLIMKAREAMPRPGYYYRSWQTIKTIISMAKDLELHQHYQYHAEGKLCGYDTVECLIRTRVWQTILVVEIMVGGPQGTSKMFKIHPMHIMHTICIPCRSILTVDRTLGVWRGDRHGRDPSVLGYPQPRCLRSRTVKTVQLLRP